MAHTVENRPAEFVVELLIYATLLAPLIVTTTSSVFPFVFPKVMYLETVVGLLVAAVLVLMSWKKSYRFVRSPFFWVLGMYAVVLGISGLYAFDPMRAFWSNFERMTGVVFIWFMIALSVCVAWFYRVNPSRIIRLCMYAVAVSVVVSATGILQYVNPSFLMGTGDRVGGVFGNPIYLGGFAAEFFLLSVYLAYRYRKSIHTWWFIVAAIINASALYLSGTRGSVLALLVAGGVFGTYWLITVYRAGYRNKALTIGAGVVLFVLMAVLFAPRIARFLPQNGNLSRFANISFSSTTGSTRLIAWNIAIQGFKERPVFGWGPENFYYVFNEHYNPKSLTFGAYETWFDHAHNAVFDALVTTGLVGIILYLLQYGVIWWMCFKTKHADKHDEVLTAVLGSFFVLHFVHNIFVFDHPGSYALFYLMAGIVAARYLASRRDSTQDVGASTEEFTTGLSIGILIVLAVTAYVVIPSLRQNSMDFTAQMSAQTKGLDVTQQEFAAAIAINGPHTADVLLDSARIAQRIPDQYLPQSVKYFEFAVRNIDTLLQKHEPANVLAALMQGQLLLRAVAFGDAQAAVRADSVFAYAARLSPKRQQIYFEWARLKLMQNKRAEGVALLEKVIGFEPSIPEAHWYLAVFLSDSDPQRALKEMKLAEQYGTNITAQNNRMITAAIYTGVGNYAEAANVYNAAILDTTFRGWDAETAKNVLAVAKKAGRTDMITALTEAFPGVQKK